MLFRLIFALLILQNSLANNENEAQKQKVVIDPKIHQPSEASSKEEIASIDNDQKGHILFFHPAGTRSHLIALNGFAEGLVENGYRVTSAIYAESKIIHDNYKEILIKDKTAEVYKKFSATWMKRGGSMLDPRIWYESIQLVKGEFRNMCRDSIIEYPELMEMIEKKIKVDAVVAMSSCGYFLAHMFDSQIIVYSPNGPFSMMIEPGLGNPINPFVQPSLIAPFIEPMTFIQRLSNIFLELVINGYTWYVDTLQMESIREHFGEDIPDSHTTLKKRSAIGIANSHFITQGSWPLYKNMIEVGGIHCKPGKDLPSDLKDYMDAHPEGVVYISFGSAIKPSSMTDEQKSVFRETFQALKGVPIIWKWDDDDLTGIPENVLVKKWLPQNDLLAHPNLKVFVTHGGLLSTQEALYHGVPLVGVPINGDQMANMMRAERHGYAIPLSLKTMTKDDLVSAIHKARTDKSIQESMLKMNELFTEDKEISPKVRAVKAVEYMIKHKGADFLKPTAIMSMPWYQVYGFDILAFVIVLISIFSVMTFKICSCCISRCFYKKTKQD